MKVADNAYDDKNNISSRQSTQPSSFKKILI